MKKLLLILIPLLLFQPVIPQTEIDSLQNIVETTRDDSLKVMTLVSLMKLYYRRNIQQSVDYGNQAVEIAQESGSPHLEAEAYLELGLAKYFSGDYHPALEDWKTAVSRLETMEPLATDSAIKLNIMARRGLTLRNIGVVYKTIGEYDKAIEYYHEDLRIQEKVGNVLAKAQSQANIANVYFSFEIDFEKALEEYNKSLELFEEYNRDFPDDLLGIRGLAIVNLSVGICHKELSREEQALDFFNRALESFISIDDQAGIATAQRNLGSVYMVQGDYVEALDAVEKSLEHNREIGQRKEVAEDLKIIGQIYYRMRRYTQALEYMNQSLEITQELDLKKEVYDVYKDMSEVYRDQGNFKQALDYYELYDVLKDSSIREENLNQISELETKYQTERVERENVLLNTQNALQEAQVKRQRIFLISVIGISFIILGGGFVVYRQYQEKKKANILLEEQNIEIKQQIDQIFQQKQEITDSIQYASRIQNAILPPDAMLNKLQEHFILYKPRDIVSGDYYWMTLKDNKTIVAAADCTGHGVPGAFMSMLGISFMNEIVNKSDTTQANEILNQLRGDVIASLKQTGEEGEAQDGMDLALCVIDTAAKKVQFSGAYNPLYIIRKNKLIEYKPDKMPIGIHKEKSDPFSNNVIDVEIGDALYLFSDGYVDQFGGVRQKKFLTKNFKELLIRINKKPMEEQKEILDNTMREWMGSVEQIDDILVMGLRI